jgi:hypothetical protein
LHQTHGTPPIVNGALREWLATARHPKTNKPYPEMIYVPMVELLTYLRANGFKTFIVSGEA